MISHQLLILCKRLHPYFCSLPFKIAVKYNIKRVGTTGSPCFTPLLILKESLTSPDLNTLPNIPSWNSLTILTDFRWGSEKFQYFDLPCQKPSWSQRGQYRDLYSVPLPFPVLVSSKISCLWLNDSLWSHFDSLATLSVNSCNLLSSSLENIFPAVERSDVPQ